MRKIFLFTLFLFVVVWKIPAQPGTSQDSMNKEIRQIVREALNESSYTRVPNQQFENSLGQQITSAVNNKFQFIYWIVGVLAFVLGGSVWVTAKFYLNESAKKSINDTVKNELERYTLELKNNTEAKLKEVGEKLDNATQQLKETKKEMLGIRLERIKQEVNDRKVADETFKSLKSSLKESESLIDPNLISIVIDILSKASYELGKETEMEKIVQTYITDDNVEMNSTVFINLAAGFFYNYYATSDPVDRQKCLTYINESLRRSSYYGEAYGLKLELLILDHSKAMDEHQKQKLELEMKEILSLATYNVGKVNSARELCDRFTRVSTGKEEKYCIDLIKTKFPEEMKELKKIAASKDKAPAVGPTKNKSSKTGSS